MIERHEIMAVATDLSLAPEVVEKDYVLGWILAAIYAHERLAQSWVFKGGTCLKKCYFETYRFSEDLDFTVLDSAHLEEGFLKATFADVAQWVLDASGVEVPLELLRFDVYRNKRGGISCQGRLSYRGPLRRGGDLQRVKLDLTVDEKIVLPPAERPVAHPYGDRPETGMVALCYAFEELLAEKTRALAERTRPRDLYDVVNLYRMDEVRPPASVVAGVPRQKCEFKNIAIPPKLLRLPSESAQDSRWLELLRTDRPVRRHAILNEPQVKTHRRGTGRRQCPASMQIATASTRLQSGALKATSCPPERRLDPRALMRPPRVDG